ncbi:hypothetical protein [Segetibacter sp.]|uniref:hypothetical protein n=1 Tax=Segetibacter sp. TaxID=2231182 RepID=UPI00262BE41E|nr:hypothetical protein [Segetibacter sp.]
MKDLVKERNVILPLREGFIDVKPIFKAASTVGLNYIFVEHDMPADPFRSIQTSIENLQQLVE